MSKFNVPTVGSTITVSTYYDSNVIGRTKAEDTHTYENVPVLSPQSWTPSGSFCIPAENEPFIKFRTIAISKVVGLTIHKGSTADIKHGTIVVPIAGSNDNIYSVVVTDGVAVSCDCKGFQYRRNCRHGRIATGESPVNPRRETKTKKPVVGRKRLTKKRDHTVYKGKTSKAAIVRRIIRGRKSAMKSQDRDTVSMVQEWCITDTMDKVGFKRGLAKSYVLNNWDKVTYEK